MDFIDYTEIDGLELLDAPFIYENSKRIWEWQSSSRSYYNLWISLGGNARMHCGTQAHQARPWTAFILPPTMEIHGFNQCVDPQMSNFSAHWLPRFTRDTGANELPLVVVDLTEIAQMENLMRSLLRLSAYRDATAMWQCQWLLMAMIGQVWRESLYPTVSQADRIIHRQIGTMRDGDQLFVTINALAEEAHLSRVHYARRFRKLTGESPSHFLIRQRVERAAVLLRETDWTIETIAQTVGYSDVYYFSRQFKATLKHTPSRFRKLRRK
jgi:AraC-like DNA-binding protein